MTQITVTQQADGSYRVQTPAGTSHQVSMPPLPLILQKVWQQQEPGRYQGPGPCTGTAAWAR